MDTINMKRLIWYGHVQRMPDERWPKRMLDWVPNRRRERGRPRRAWRENIQRWNGEICIVEIGKIENYGMQDAENGDSCKKPALYIYNEFIRCG